MKKSTKILFVLVGIIAICLAGCLNFVNYPNKGSTDVYSMDDEDLKNLDDKTAKCWHIYAAFTYGDKSTDEEETYVWGTEYDIAMYCFEYMETQEAEAEAMGKILAVRASYQEANAKTKEACDKLAQGEVDPSGGGKKQCWEVYHYEGSSMITDRYLWCTKDEALAYARELQDKSGKYTYEVQKAYASDKSICEAANGDDDPDDPDVDDYTDHCWEVWCMYSDTKRHSEYMWKSKSFVVKLVKSYEQTNGMIWHYTLREPDNVSDCNKLISIEGDPKPDNGEGKYDDNGTLACWREDIEGQITYKWCYEYFVKSNCKSYQSMGYNATYTKTSITDEETCNNTHD